MPHSSFLLAAFNSRANEIAAVFKREILLGASPAVA
jgi:hypothetical protein